MEEKQIIISIIVPVYRVQSYISKFISSIIDQKNKQNFEVILIDDCGGDNSIEIAQTILKGSNISYKIVYHEKNKGLSAARNSGIEKASGDYLYFADSDDIIENNTLHNFMEIIRNHPEQKLFFFNASYTNIEEDNLQQWRGQGELDTIIHNQDFLKLLYNGQIGAYIWQFLFHRDLFNTLNFKEGSVWEDAIIMPQILNQISSVASFDHIFIYRYILREGSITQTIHPQLINVVSALNEVEDKLYPFKNENLYLDFVNFRTVLAMRLSRECFVRTNNFKQLMQIHKTWGKSIPETNLNALKILQKNKSAIFLKILKKYPSVLYFLYRLKLLK